MNGQTLYNLIAKQLAGDITADEKQRLQQWLAASDENTQLYERLKVMWQESRVPEPDEMPDVRQEWLALQKSLRQAEQPSLPERVAAAFRQKAANIPVMRLRSAAVVPAVLLLFVIGLGLWKLYISGPRWRTVATANGEKATVNLADGSILRLNSGSSVRFARHFSDTLRQVFLSGEAYFEVVKDGRPFRVITANAVTSVLGTRFDVWARDGVTRVVVAQGRVRLAPLDNESKFVVLAQNQKSRVAGNRPPEPPVRVNANNLLAWLNDRLVFEKAPLAEIIGELERTFDVRIDLANSISGHLTLTADFDRMDIQTILNSICITLNLRYEKRDDKYILETKRE